MKLAETLILRADLQKRVEQLRARLQKSAVVQEGEQPPENPSVLFAELENILAQLEALISQINRTNLQTALSDGTTLTDALARRDVLRLRVSVLQSVADTAGSIADRYGRAEIRKLPTVEVGALRQQSDTLSRQARELDTAIQAANWTNDLVE